MEGWWCRALAKRFVLEGKPTSRARGLDGEI